MSDVRKGFVDSAHLRKGDPLISVALSTYNGAEFLEQQLDSLLSQTYPNLEIVAADDCSTDDTVQILKRYAERDARIRVLIRHRNLGVNRSFNESFAECTGAFIAPCDQDDIWHPEKLSVLMSAIGEKAVAYCDSELIDSRGRTLNRRMSSILGMASTDDPLTLALANCASGHAMLIRRSVCLEASDVPDHVLYDWWIAAVAASRGGVVFVDRCLVQYRQHGGNVSDILSALGPNSRVRPAGYKALELSIIGSRLRSLALLHGPYQERIVRIARLWSRRESQWVSPALGWLVTRHRRRIFMVTRMRGTKLWRNALRFFTGLRTKRLTNGHAYRVPLDDFTAMDCNGPQSGNIRVMR